MKIQIAALIATLVIVFGSPTFAQQAPSATEKLEFRKWDVGGSLGILGSSRRDFGGHPAAGYESGPYGAWNIDVGRYFTPHLKAEAGLMWTGAHSFYDTTFTQTVPNSSRFRTVHPTSVSGAVTYQFFENVFAHPYVSAGIRVTSLYEETETYVYSNDYTSSTVSTGNRRSTETRPFMAAGYKFYFNERAYMRSDFLLAIDRRGPSHGTLRIGFGIDF